MAVQESPTRNDQERGGSRVPVKGKIIPSVLHHNVEPIVTFCKAWRAACRKAGCPGRIPHDMRRSAVWNLVRANVSDKAAMQLTRHKARSVLIAI